MRKRKINGSIENDLYRHLRQDRQFMSVVKRAKFRSGRLRQVQGAG